MLNKTELEIFKRQISFEKIGFEGQESLKTKTVAVVGCGATGILASEMLVRSGVGKVKVIDRDIVELSNLQSQSLFTLKDVGKPKAIAAKQRLTEINNSTAVEEYPINLGKDNVGVLGGADLVLDCTDNLETRFLINDYCKKFGVSWVHAAVTGSKGEVLAITPDCGYCFECVFGNSKPLESCETRGVIPSTVHMAVSLQISEGLKILLKLKPTHKLVRFDAWNFWLSQIDVKGSIGCNACNRRFLHLSKDLDAVELCGSGMINVKIDFDYDKLKSKLSQEDTFFDYGSAFRYNDITFFEGRALIKAKSIEDARSKLGFLKEKVF